MEITQASGAVVFVPLIADCRLLIGNRTVEVVEIRLGIGVRACGDRGRHQPVGGIEGVYSAAWVLRIREEPGGDLLLGLDPRRVAGDDAARERRAVVVAPARHRVVGVVRPRAGHAVGAG